MKNYTIIQSELQLYSMLKKIDEWDYISFDTETTGLNTRKDKIIGLSVCGQVGHAYYLPRLSWYEGRLHQQCEDEVFINVLNKLKSKDLLMWNASFDIRMVKSNFDIDLLPALIADVMLMKHTVDEENPFGLKEVAIMVQDKIGFNAEQVANQEQIELKENVSKNGGSITKSNFEMYKADLEVLGKYACSDADLTFRLAEYYRAEIEKDGMWDFFFEEEVMPLYKEVTIPMEEKGVKLDMKLITENYSKLVDKVKFYEQKVKDVLCSTDAFKRWLEDKLESKYPISTKGNFAQLVAEYYDLPLPKTDTGKYSINKKTLKDIIHPAVDFLNGIGELPKEVVVEIQTEMLRRAEGDVINVSSKDHLATLCFNYMGLKPLSKTDSGKDQFDQEFVQSISDKHEWASYLNTYNKLSKIKSSYYDRFLEGQEDGYYYFSYKQHGTISGRYSSDAQQLPRPIEEGTENEDVIYFNNIIRAFMISTEGRIFIDDDYESLEPHVFAHVSTDEKLRDIFRKGHDFYSTIAIQTEGLYEYSADKKAENYLGKLAKSIRQNAKAYSLGIPYGMSAYALAMALEIPKDEAKRLHEGYLGGFPDLAQWMESSEEMAKNLGYVVTMTGRKRHLSKVKDLYERFGDKLLDFKSKRMLEFRYGPEQVKQWAMDYKNGLNNAKNFQIQGLSASIVNRAAIAVTRRFKAAGIDGWVCAQIHDQLIFDVPENRKEEAAAIVQDCMENTTKISIALKAKPSFAHNWKEGH